MRRNRLSQGLLGMAVIIAIAWQVESLTRGRGLISIYLAPAALLALFASVLLRDAGDPSEEDAALAGVRRHGILLLLIAAALLLTPLFWRSAGGRGSSGSSAAGAVAAVAGIALINVHRALRDAQKRSRAADPNAR